MASAVLIADASNFVFHATQGACSHTVNRQGRIAKAIHNFVDFTHHLLNLCQPQRITLIFNQSMMTDFRKAIYLAYKANNRRTLPVELRRQFTQIRLFLRLGGYLN